MRRGSKKAGKGFLQALAKVRAAERHARLTRDSDSGSKSEDAGTAAEAVGPQSGDSEAGASPNLSSPPPVDSKGVVERLRATRPGTRYTGYDWKYPDRTITPAPVPINPDGPEAADLIDRLTASEERLREALETQADEYRAAKRMKARLSVDDLEWNARMDGAENALRNFARQALGEDNAS